MIRNQLRWHRHIWMVLGPLLLAAVAWAWIAGQQYPAQSRPDGAVGVDKR